MMHLFPFTGRIRLSRRGVGLLFAVVIVGIVSLLITVSIGLQRIADVGVVTNYVNAQKALTAADACVEYVLGSFKSNLAASVSVPTSLSIGTDATCAITSPPPSSVSIGSPTVRVDSTYTIFIVAQVGTSQRKVTAEILRQYTLPQNPPPPDSPTPASVQVQLVHWTQTPS